MPDWNLIVTITDGEGTVVTSFDLADYLKTARAMFGGDEEPVLYAIARDELRNDASAAVYEMVNVRVHGRRESR
jgi:hypothetical protein